MSPLRWLRHFIDHNRPFSRPGTGPFLEIGSSVGATGKDGGSPQRTERLTELFDKGGRLLQSGEVPAPFELTEVGDYSRP